MSFLRDNATDRKDPSFAAELKLLATFETESKTTAAATRAATMLWRDVDGDM